MNNVIDGIKQKIVRQLTELAYNYRTARDDKFSYDRVLNVDTVNCIPIEGYPGIWCPTRPLVIVGRRISLRESMIDDLIGKVVVCTRSRYKNGEERCIWSVLYILDSQGRIHDLLKVFPIIAGMEDCLVVDMIGWCKDTEFVKRGLSCTPIKQWLSCKNGIAEQRYGNYSGRVLTGVERIKYNCINDLVNKYVKFMTCENKIHEREFVVEGVHCSPIPIAKTVWTPDSVLRLAGTRVGHRSEWDDPLLGRTLICRKVQGAIRDATYVCDVMYIINTVDDLRYVIRHDPYLVNMIDVAVVDKVMYYNKTDRFYYDAPMLYVYNIKDYLNLTKVKRILEECDEES